MFDAESAEIRRQRQFLHEIEAAIRAANRRIIHARIPHLDRQSFVAFASRVAELRAAYLEAALALGGDGAVPAAAAELSVRRVAFEEAREAFAALERAIERGYVDIV